MLRILLVIVILSLTGCDGFSQKSVATMCDEEQSLCSDLNPDSWCRAEKSAKANVTWRTLGPKGEEEGAQEPPPRPSPGAHANLRDV